jgi:hypothetical protein
MGLGLGVSGVAAQDLRDPTQPPLAMRPPVVAASGAAPQGAEDALPGLSDGTAVVLREGTPYLAYGTRLYGVGQKIEGFRIERISETEVWLRSPTELRKLTRFADVKRTVVRATPEECVMAPPAPTASAAARAKSKAARTAKSISKSPISPVAPDAALCAGAKP